jgi:site-specific recombinase XerD
VPPKSPGSFGRIAQWKSTRLTSERSQVRPLLRPLVPPDLQSIAPGWRTTSPFVPEKAVPVLTIEQMRALLDQRKGREFIQLRDTAVIRLLLDSGRMADYLAPFRSAA